MNFKNIVWFIKAISYFVLLRSLNNNNNNNNNNITIITMIAIITTITITISLLNRGYKSVH